MTGLECTSCLSSAGHACHESRPEDGFICWHCDACDLVTPVVNGVAQVRRGPTRATRLRGLAAEGALVTAIVDVAHVDRDIVRIGPTESESSFWARAKKAGAWLSDWMLNRPTS